MYACSEPGMLLPDRSTRRKDRRNPIRPMPGKRPRRRGGTRLAPGDLSPCQKIGCVAMPRGREHVGVVYRLKVDRRWENSLHLNSAKTAAEVCRTVGIGRRTVFSYLAQERQRANV